jgi:hypothetical protein
MVSKLLSSARRRLRAGLWGVLGLNAFVYGECTQSHIKWPDIPVRPVELYGQCGEDLIVLSLMKAKALSDAVDLRGKHYLEVGGNHPFATSATFLMSKYLGMTGAIVGPAER